MAYGIVAYGLVTYGLVAYSLVAYSLVAYGFVAYGLISSVSLYGLLIHFGVLFSLLIDLELIISR